MAAGRIKLIAGEANGASAIAHELDTIAAYSTAGAKLLSVKSQGIEKFVVDKDGVITTGSAGSTLSSATTINAFIDNDNTGTTETFDIYKDVTVPTVASLLLRISESKQHGMGTDAPFQNIGSTGDLASTDMGLHIKQAGVGDQSHIILEAAGNLYANYWFARTSSQQKVHRLYADNSRAAIQLHKMSTTAPDTILNRFMEWTESNNEGGCVGIGRAVPIDGSAGLYVSGNAGVNETLIEVSMNSAGTIRPAARMAIANGTNATPSNRQFYIEPTYDAGYFALPAITFKGNTGSSLPPRVGFGTYTPDYAFEFDRLEGGTTMVQLCGLNTANNTGHTAKVYRNLTATSTDSAVMFIHDDHASDDQDLLSLQQDGSGKLIASSVFNVDNAGALTLSSTVDGVDISTHDHSTSTAQTRLAAKDRRRFAQGEKHAADVAVTDVLAEHMLLQAQDALTITKCFFLPDAGLTANDTNFATLKVWRRDSAGANQAAIASLATTVAGSGNWTAFDAEDLGSLTNTAIAAGEVVTWEITKTVAGVIVPSGTLQIEYTVD